VPAGPPHGWLHVGVLGCAPAPPDSPYCALGGLASGSCYERQPGAGGSHVRSCRASGSGVSAVAVDRLSGLHSSGSSCWAWWPRGWSACRSRPSVAAPSQSRSRSRPLSRSLSRLGWRRCRCVSRWAWQSRPGCCWGCCGCGWPPWRALALRGEWGDWLLSRRACRRRGRSCGGYMGCVVPQSCCLQEDSAGVVAGGGRIGWAARRPWSMCRTLLTWMAP
jgi:hypothetical protein